MRYIGRKIFAVIFVTVILLSCMPSAAFALDKKNECQVTFRIVFKGYYNYAGAGLEIAKYKNAKSTEPTKIISVDAYREDQWERTVPLEPGFYKVLEVSPHNEWKKVLEGNTKIFEVKGKEMTVYVGCTEEGETVEMPTEPIVYGKITKEFGYWRSNEEYEEDMKNSGSQGKETTYLPHGGSLETDGEKSEITGTPDTAPSGYTEPKEKEKTPIIKDPSSEPISQSSKIGNIIIYSSFLIAIVIALILIKRKKKH